MEGGPIGAQLLLQAVLIAINAFFAAAEIALLSLNENKLRKQMEEGDKKAETMLKMVMTPEGFLSTIQVAITMAGFLGSAFAASNFSQPLARQLLSWGVPMSFDTLNTICVILVTLILSYLTLILGELVPKRVAMKKPDAVARGICGVVHGVAVAFKPVVWLLSKSTNGVLRLMGIDPGAQEEEVTEDEIRMMVDIGEEKGAIEGNEREMIENIFEFNNLTAADCMTHRTDMTALWVDETQEIIVRTIEESGLSRFPVFQEDMDDIIGTVTTRDILLNMRHGGKKTLRELARPAYFVPESVRTDVLFRDMQQSKKHLAIVVDEYGGTSGLITMEDLLEEIVGNIYDEYDPQTPQDIVKIGDNLWRVAGSTEMERLCEALDVALPEQDEFDTLGGLVFSRMSAIPKDGTHPEMDCYGMHIAVEEIKDRRVEWARVQVLPKAQPDQPQEEA